MKKQIIKLKDVLGRAVSKDEAEDVVDYLLACLTHVTNARSLFGIVNTQTGELDWMAGGADFKSLFQAHQNNQAATDVTSLAQLFECLQLSVSDLTGMQNHMDTLIPQGVAHIQQHMTGRQGHSFRIVLRRRSVPNDHQVQFSFLDITPFEVTLKRTQEMAKGLWAEMGKSIKGSGGAKNVLINIINKFDTLFRLTGDEEIRAMTEDMSHCVTLLNERMVGLLLDIEKRYGSQHWQPEDLDPDLSPSISVHRTSLQDWNEQRNRVMTIKDGEPAVSGVDVDGLKQAYAFVQHAQSLFVISPTPGTIYVLNGPMGGHKFATVENFVAAIHVEENSISTATDFFKSLDQKTALSLFAIADQNVEVWGRPGLYKGWQAMMASSFDRTVDVRGLFHGLKNLLLHLQVLYVVKTCADVDEVKSALSESADKIRKRLADLETIALTGHREHDTVKESVGQWLNTVRRLGEGVDADIRVNSPDVDQILFLTSPGEMEDTLEELVRNALQHGASQVNVKASQQDGYLKISVLDNGRGMTEGKLKQVLKVLKSKRYDETLSTRKGGTGNGLLAASNVILNFVDGAFEIKHGAHGHGTEVLISIKLPA